MRLCGYFHLFPKEHNAGSETTVHAALRAMVQRSHDVKVICDRSLTAPYTIDGIQVVRPPRRGQQSWLQNFVTDCDLLVTHLDLTSLAMSLATDVHKPLAHFVHNSAQLDYWHVKDRKCDLAIFNSDWVADLQKWEGKQITIHPVVEPEYYRCERGDSIALANPTSGKGAATFYQMAERMPERQFLTAQGGYGIQVPCPQDRSRAQHTFYDDKGSDLPCYGLPNVIHLKNDPDIRNVFRRTRVLLMPSEYESYGRVGVEAACAGIPTIAHPTPGLTEAFGQAGIFIDRNDYDAWETEINRLFNDEVYYRQRSNAVLALANSLTPEEEFDRLEKALIETVEEWMYREQRQVEKILLSNRRLGKTANGRLTDNLAEAITLICGEAGQPIPAEFNVQALHYGFVQIPAIQTESLMDTTTLNPRLEAKAVEEPQENKAIEGPAENKGKRRKKEIAA